MCRRGIVLFGGVLGIAAAGLSADRVAGPRAGVVPDRAGLHVYVTTPDAQWDSRYPPQDSVATVSAFFERLARVQNVSRVYWRGAQAESGLKHFVFRPENPLYYDFWSGWQRYLYLDQSLNRIAVREAHRWRTQIFVMQGLFDFGAPGDAEYSHPLPYYGGDRLLLDHQEWAPLDRWGERRQPGPIELAYPEARRAVVDRFTSEVLDGGYDGLFLYTYIENYSTRFEDEFGFNAPIVAEYRRRYGVDIRTEPFDRRLWGELRGEYVTGFLEQLHRSLQSHGRRLSVALSAKAPDRIQDHPLNSGRISSSIRLDWRTWVERGLVDEIAIMGGTDAEAITLAEQIVTVARVGVSVTILTESPADAKFLPLAARGVTLTGWSAPYRGAMELYSQKKPALDDLAQGEWRERAQAAVIVADGTLAADAQVLAALTTDSHVLVRREAIRGLVVMQARQHKAAIEAALDDSEESVRVAAVVALASIGDVTSVAPIRRALRRGARFMVKEASVLTLAAFGRAVVPELVDALRSPVVAERQVAVRALGRIRTHEDVQTLLRVAREDTDEYVRFYAIDWVQRIQLPQVVDFLLTAATDRSPTIQMCAVRGLEATATAMSADQARRTLVLLGGLFSQYGQSTKRSDAEWGWRIVSRAMLALGPAGRDALDKHRIDGADAVLARRAYYALYVPMRPEQYTDSSWDEDEQAHKRFAR